MKLTPVESSHIAAIGYLEDECVIFLRYRDGTLYAMPGMPPRVWDALCAAESKGRYVERLREPMVRILKGGSTGDREPEQQCGAACGRFDTSDWSSANRINWTPAGIPSGYP